MQGNPETLDILNEILTAELTAVNQYFIHAKMCRTGASTNCTITPERSRSTR